MMDRYNPNRDNSPSGRPLHTYTPRSHEDLLRSHLQLDASRNAKLQNELHRLADENKRLRHDLDNALKDNKGLEDEVDDLKKKLRQTPKTPTQLRTPLNDSPNRVFEIDGKPVTLDQILDHFDGVIQKHHDLLNRKNQKIENLEDALRNSPKKEFMPVETIRTQTPQNNKNENDFAKELALIRKEYEQVEHLLTQRNNKLENLIEDLRKKLEQYADEIGRLRKELENRGMDPNESTVRLLKEKERENDYLKDLINKLQKQPQNVMLPISTNGDLENEIRRIIEDKKNVVKKLSNMIVELKKTPSENIGNPDISAVEKECKAMMGDLNNMNDKLNNVLQRLKETPQTAQGEPVNKDDLLSNLNTLKKQCENEIKALNNQLKSPTKTPIVVADPMRSEVPETIKPYEPIGYSNSQPIKPYEHVRYRDTSPVSSLKSYRPVDYITVTPPEVSYRHLPKTYQDQEPKTKPKERLYPEIPSETQSLPPKPRPHSPFTCEACQEDVFSPRDPQKHTSRKLEESYVHPQVHKPPRHKSPKSKKKGCCTSKPSETSNVPYQKLPEEEQVVYIHHPESSHHTKPKWSLRVHPPKSKKDSPKNSPKPPRKVISKLRTDQKT